CSPKTVKINGKVLKNGQAMVVSEDTYVTLSFIPEAKGPSTPEGGDSTAKSYSAKVDQKTGTYSVELPPGQYRTKPIIVPPAKTKAKPDGKLNAPTPPINSPTAYDLTKSRELDIEATGK